MTQRWTKRGLIFEPPTDSAWMASHAALPIAQALGDFHRIYFSGRDAAGRARIGSFDAEFGDRTRIISVCQTPVLDLGEPGSFDESGVTSSCLVPHDGHLYLFYTGWTLGVTVPFYFFVGLAVSDDDGASFRRVSRGPILERSIIDPFLTASPFVLIEGGLWRMWYVSCCRWVLEDGQPKHFYHIRYAESRDGVSWDRRGHVCIDFKDNAEYALARPFVLKEDGRYKMWFCARGDRYQIGYAESADGLSWQRNDQVTLDGTAQAWDADMQAYPFIMDHGSRRLMLYNGNGYGRTGIGLAEFRTGDPSWVTSTSS